MTFVQGDEVTWPDQKNLPTYYLPTYLPAYPPTHLPTNLRKHPQGVILEPCDNWDIWSAAMIWHLGCCDIRNTDYNTDNWEPGFMTIFVTWHLIVTLDSNSCDVWGWHGTWVVAESTAGGRNACQHRCGIVDHYCAQPCQAGSLARLHLGSKMKVALRTGLLIGEGGAVPIT